MKGFMLLLVTSGLLLCGCPQEQATNTTTPPTDKGGGGDKTPAGGGDKTPAGGGDKTPAGGTVKVENFWKGVGVGTVAEYKTVTDMTKPMANKSESTSTWTLDSKDDKKASIKMVTHMNGMDMPSPAPMEIPFEAPAATGDVKATTKDLGKEKIKVEAGEFECDHSSTESETAGTKSSTESWSHKGLSVKSVTKMTGASEMTVTMELTKLDKK